MDRTTKIMHRHTLGLLLLSVFLSSCFLLPKEEEILAPPLMKPPEITYNLIHPKKGDLYNKVVVSGYFGYPRQHSLFFKEGGKLKGVYVDYGDRVRVGQLMAELENESLVRQIKKQQISVDIAETTRARIIATGADKFQLRLEDLGVQLARLNLQELQNDLSKAQVRAPMAGIVVYVAQNEEGEHIAPYTTLVQLAEPTELLLTYSGANVSDFRMNQEVEVHIEEDIYRGEVVLNSDSLPEDAPQNMRNKVFITVYDLPADVTKGVHAFIHLILEKAEGIHIVPRHVVKTYKGTTFVYVLEEGLRKQKNVLVGLQTSTEAAILDGLDESDAVISR